MSVDWALERSERDACINRLCWLKLCLHEFHIKATYFFFCVMYKKLLQAGTWHTSCDTGDCVGGCDAGQSSVAPSTISPTISVKRDAKKSETSIFVFYNASRPSNHMRWRRAPMYIRSMKVEMAAYHVRCCENLFSWPSTSSSLQHRGRISSATRAWTPHNDTL